MVGISVWATTTPRILQLAAKQASSFVAVKNEHNYTQLLGPSSVGYGGPSKRNIEK
jgi:hypothetical protein